MIRCILDHAHHPLVAKSDNFDGYKSIFFALMQYTYATSAYHEARFLVHFHLAIWANFERGDIEAL